MIRDDIPFFAKWCSENGIQVRAGKGKFEVLQILVPGDKHGWARLWRNQKDKAIRVEARVAHVVWEWRKSGQVLPLLEHCGEAHV